MRTHALPGWLDLFKGLAAVFRFMPAKPYAPGSVLHCNKTYRIAASMV